MPQKDAIKQAVEDVKQATDRFTPARILPVNIDYADPCNPYELATDVVYDNGIVKVTMERTFKWDGASIPTWLPVVPWLLNLLAMYLWDSPWLWALTAVLVVYTIRILPYMQKMGRHARAACVHDKLCRAQSVARVVADAIFLSILESDGIPWDVRWQMYLRVRQFGWIPWRKNRRALAAKAAAQRHVEINPDSELAPPKGE